MRNLEILGQKIADLEGLAEKIESSGNELIKGATLRYKPPHPRVASVDPRYHWQPLPEELKDLQREVIRKYELWYSTARQLVRKYLPEREEQFVTCYKDTKSWFVRRGVIDYLRLGSGQSSDDKGEIASSFMKVFDTQRNIVESIAASADVTPEAGPDATAEIIEICKRLHRVAVQLKTRQRNKPNFEIADEYDVQDLLVALLQVRFHDVRREETTPTLAGSASIIDVLVEDQRIGIEVKKTSKHITQRKLVDQLLVDIGRYKKHPDCKTLVCFIYDPEQRITNPTGLRQDLNSQSTDQLRVITIVEPS